MNDSFSLVSLSETGQATVLRGFATQIQLLKFPKLHVVKDIANAVGLVIMTKEEAQSYIISADVATEITDAIAETQIALDKLTKMRQSIIKILGSGNMFDNVKLNSIAEIVK